MKNKTCKQLFFVLSVILLIYACNKDDASNSGGNDDDNSTIIVAPEFQEFYNSFLDEMESRGRDLRDRSITVVFVNQITAPNSSQFCAYGYPNFNNSGQARVEVINSQQCWGRWNTIQKENLMYHEFGHALLSKGHTDTFFPNGSPIINV